MSIVRLLVFICVTVFIMGCNGRPAPVQAPAPTSFNVTLVCTDCANEGIEINLWETPDRVKGVGSVPHNTPATVLETTTHDGRSFYRVSVNGLTGWLPEDFVKK